MQSELPETSEQVPQTNIAQAPSLSSHHGSHQLPHNVLAIRSVCESEDASKRSASSGGAACHGGPDAKQLDERLRRLSAQGGQPDERSKAAVPGQRVSDYENAMLPSAPRQPLGFRVVHRPSNGIQLTDFPNGSSPLGFLREGALEVY